MVYKKIIRKGGKVYGPYLYENKRVGNKVITNYIGKFDKGDRNKLLGYYLLIGLIVIVAAFLFIYSYPTGKAVLDIDSTYKKGEIISGDLKLTLRQGELLPKDSRIIVNYGGKGKESLLFELVDFNFVEGSFFVEDVNLSGKGEGYGLEGSSFEIYPEIDFELLVFDRAKEEQKKKEQPEEEKLEEQPQEQMGQGNIGSAEGSDTGNAGGGEENSQSSSESAESSENEQSSETFVGESSSSQNSEANEVGEGTSAETNVGAQGTESQITGAVIEESEIKVKGKVSKGKDFSYNLAEAQEASIAEGSVSYKGEKIGDDKINLIVENGIAKVSSDFGVEEKGFGEEFLGDEEVILVVNLSKFNLTAFESGALKITIVYGEREIVSAEKNIEVGEDLPVTEKNETLNITSNITEDINVSMNLTRELNVSINLTEENATRISNVSIKTLRYKIRVGEPVKWVKNITLLEQREIVIELPKEAENISVKKIDKGKEAEALVEAQGITGNIVSGRISAEIEINKERGLLGFLRKIFSKITGKMTGRAISGIDANETNQSSINITLVDNATNYLIEYYTEPALAFEEETSSGKKVIVSAPEQLNYTDVLVSSNLTKKLHISAASKIRVYWNNYEYSNRNIVLKDVDDVEDIEIVEEERYIDERSNIKNETQNETLENIINETEIVIDNTGNESQISNESEIIDVDETLVGNESQLGERNLITGRIISNISDEDLSSEEISNGELLNETGENEEIEGENTLEDNEGRKYIKESLSFEIYDIDNDSYIDYIEWVAPHLSNQTFEIIEITKAEHLDSDREFIEDIYDSVRAKDDNWTASIPAGHYVRVVFEENLTKDRDITIYAQASGAVDSTVRINGVDVPCEVYKKKLRLDELRRQG